MKTDESPSTRFRRAPETFQTVWDRVSWHGVTETSYMPFSGGLNGIASSFADAVGLHSAFKRLQNRAVHLQQSLDESRFLQLFNQNVPESYIAALAGRVDRSFAML